MRYFNFGASTGLIKSLTCLIMLQSKDEEENRQKDRIVERQEMSKPLSQAYAEADG